MKKTQTEIIEEVQKYRIEQQRKFEVIRDDKIKSSNGSFDEAVKQLIFVGTVVFTFSSPIFINRDLLNSLSARSKTLLLIAWSLLILSIGFGVIQFFIERNFYKKWADANDEIIKIIAENKVPIGLLGEEVLEKQKDLPLQSNLLPILLQGLTLLIGIITLIVFLTESILFK
jgi:hypothetical protein